MTSSSLVECEYHDVYPFSPFPSTLCLQRREAEMDNLDSERHFAGLLRVERRIPMSCMYLDREL